MANLEFSMVLKIKLKDQKDFEYLQEMMKELKKKGIINNAS